MEAFPTQNAKVVDVQGRKISQYCLGLPTVLRQILELISNEQLIQLSLVSKLWNFEARSVLRARGSLKAYIFRGGHDAKEDCPCKELKAFASDLKKMHVVPFSGIHFAIDHRVVCQKSFSTRSLQPSHKIILDRMHWKHLFVQFGFNYWRNYKDCQALWLIKQILEDFGGVLEELNLGFASEQFLGPIFKDRTLQRLKILSIWSWVANTADGTLPSTFIKKLVSCAPNLQELHVNAAVDLGDNILEGSSAVLVANCGLSPLFKPISEGLISSIRANEMTIMIHTERINPELLNRFIPKVLEASRTTLKTLIIDYLFAVPLMCYGICLENVTTLKIHINSNRRACRPRRQNIDPWTLPRGLHFTRVFPSLTEVKILDDYGHNFSSDVVSAFVQQAHEVLRMAPPDRATNIKHLDLEECGAILNDFILPLLAHMFPHVKTVRTKSEHQGALFEDLREHFPCLEEVIES